MKRIAKYRGKRIDTGEWIFGSYFKKPILHGYHSYIYVESDSIHDEDEGWIQVEHETVGQYLGIKDRDGVEIYEGDIVLDMLGKYTVVWNARSAKFSLEIHYDDDASGIRQTHKDLETFLKAKHNLSKCKVIYTDIGTIDVLVDNGLEDFLYWIDNSVVDFLGDDYVLSLVYTFEEYEDCIN